MKIYLVYSNPCCEDDEICSCHFSAKDFEGAYLSKGKAVEASKKVCDRIYILHRKCKNKYTRSANMGNKKKI